MQRRRFLANLLAFTLFDAKWLDRVELPLSKIIPKAEEFDEQQAAEERSKKTPRQYHYHRRYHHRSRKKSDE
jgi:Zn-finger nucleic acid-binding protein